MSAPVHSITERKARCAPIKFAFGKCPRCGKDMEGGPGHYRTDTGVTVHPDYCLICEGAAHRERAL